MVKKLIILNNKINDLHANCYPRCNRKQSVRETPLESCCSGKGALPTNDLAALFFCHFFSPKQVYFG